MKSPAQPENTSPAQTLDASALRLQLAALHASTSWRLTAPLRWAVGTLKAWLNKAAAIQPNIATTRDYAQWVREFDSPSAEVHANLKAQINGFAALPLFSILMPCAAQTIQDAAALTMMEATLASVREQSYPNWELCIAVDVHASNAMQHLLARSTQAEPRIKLSYVMQTATLEQLSNHALSMASAAENNPSCWVLRINAIDLIAIQAINTTAIAINDDKNCHIVYADEDILNLDGNRSDPYFKCDWNPDLHLSHNLIGRFGIYRTALVKRVGGYQTGMAEAMDFDLSLRCLEHVESKQIVHIPHILFHGVAASPRASNMGAQALNAYFKRQHIEARAENISHGYRIRYALPQVLPQVLPQILPLVSLIIPTRNGLTLLRQCIDSILQKTTYQHYEIVIVDNGSDDPDTLAYLASLSQMANMQVLRIDAPFNYAALNNAAVKVAKGGMIGLINNDIEVISPDWLGELVSHALRQGVGAVGARLWFPDNTLQHGGIVLGIHGWAAHAHNHFRRGSLGYQGRMALTQNFSAVTGACLVVKKANYLEVGGLNEDALKISCNDVDFCLKLQKIGLRNVWTPFADLYHHESATRGFEDTPAKKARFVGELAYMQQHWGDVMANDPAYSPNLTLTAQDFSLAWPPRVPNLSRPVDLQPGQAPLYERLATLRQGEVRVAYFAENVHSSTFRYRAANMAEVLNSPSAGGSSRTLTISAACFFSSDVVHATQIANNADILVISRARYDAGLADLVQHFKTQGKKVWFDLDDWVVDTAAIGLIIDTLGQQATDDTLNYWHAVVGRMAQALRLCDGVITTNDYLSKKISQHFKLPVNIIPNFVNQAQMAVSEPMYLSKLTTAATHPIPRERIKLGYFSGSASHNKDLSIIAYALERVMAADTRIELVLVGHVDIEQAFGARFGGYLKGHLANRVTLHSFVDFVALQALIADVDFNLVPLQTNAFTHCKSELKFVDAAIVGTLTIASPTFAYGEAICHGKNGYLAKDEQWESVLLEAIAVRDSNHELHKRMTMAAYEDVQQRFTWRSQLAAILQALEVS